MKNVFYIVTVIFLTVIGLTVNAKPRCQGFNNYDNKVTIVFTDNQAKDKYTVSDVKLIPSSWSEKEYPATSVEVTVKKGVATVTLTFPHVTQFSNPQVTLRINGKIGLFLAWKGGRVTVLNIRNHVADRICQQRGTFF